jgi:hypothetical protein
MNPLLTTKFGPMIARTARAAVNGYAHAEEVPMRFDLTEEQVWKKMWEELPKDHDAIPDKDGYGLIFQGDITELSVFRKHAGEPNGFQYGDPVYLRTFDTPEDRAAFKAKLMEFLKPFKDPAIRFDEIEGSHNTKRPVALATVKWQGKEYDIRKEYSYGYPLNIVLFDWEENNTACDCNRLIMIERFYPNTTGAYAGDGKPCTWGEVVVTAFGIAFAEGKVNHGAPYPSNETKA